MTTMDDEPDNASITSDDAWLQDENMRRDTLYAVVSKIVNTFVDLEVALHHAQPICMAMTRYWSIHGWSFLWGYYIWSTAMQ